MCRHSSQNATPTVLELPPKSKYAQSSLDADRPTSKWLCSKLLPGLSLATTWDYVSTDVT